jgi:hypothetical protein
MTSLIRLLAHWSRQQKYRRCYLNDTHWVDFRHQWWQKNPHRRCVLCGCGHPLDLHHLTYVRIGHENDSDVVPLCRRHHNEVHRRHGVIYA